MTIKVKKVIDGDTFQDSRNRFYRLANVDAPEKTERGYKTAKENLKSMIAGEELVVKQLGESYNTPNYETALIDRVIPSANLEQSERSL